MAASGNAWQDRQHFNPKTPTPNTSFAPSPGDTYSGNFSGGNNGGRGNHNAIFNAEGDGLETMLGRIEAMLSNGSNMRRSEDTRSETSSRRKLKGNSE
ncbi:hypothetical protein BDN71DRAFT_1503191 [Pleurotus eryngii]|uniref:Uncharacterized protein n=1 Tax=Pleurotus eryngii TaxID=5323 RepID=A0A9P6A540_PLEER|nr:hypothetical protein BDN71DRAFT_1503191 [Pleurotus eryngii]